MSDDFSGRRETELGGPRLGEGVDREKVGPVRKLQASGKPGFK